MIFYQDAIICVLKVNGDSSVTVSLKSLNPSFLPSFLQLLGTSVPGTTAPVMNSTEMMPGYHLFVGPWQYY